MYVLLPAQMTLNSLSPGIIALMLFMPTYIIFILK